MNALKGIRFLEKTGPYDEILTGSSWFNLGVQRYIWENFEGHSSTPQVLLMHNNFKTSPVGNSLGRVERNEKVIERFRGVDEIRKLTNFLKKDSTVKIQAISKENIY